MAWQAISENCWLLDARLAAGGYTNHDAVDHFGSWQFPASAQADGSSSRVEDDHADGGDDSGGQQPPDVPGPGKRKRKRKSRYEPTAPELEAARRAEAAVPLLKRALASLQQWLATQGAASLLPPSQAPTDPATAAQEAAPAALHSGGYPPSSAPGAAAAGRVAGGSPSPATAPPAADASGGAAGLAPGPAPDYVAMAALRHALRPKFAWAAAAGEGGGAGRGLPGGGAQCNLFGQLVRNGGAEEVLGLAAGHEVVIPGRSAFLMSDLRQLAPLVQEAAACGGFHCVVLDPPWENKSAQRGAKYPTLPSRNLLALPLPALLAAPSSGAPAPGGANADGRSEREGAHASNEAEAEGGGAGERGGNFEVGQRGTEGAAGSGGGAAPAAPAAGPSGGGGGGGLVALWVTNRERHRRFIEQELLPAWGLRHEATWYWLKVTTAGAPVGRLDIAHRRPFEPILLCRPAADADSPAQAQQPQQPPSQPPPLAGEAGEEQQAQAAQQPRPAAGQPGGGSPERIPDGLVLLSEPTQHSRKPHLGPLLRPYLPPNPRCLEMFAREMFHGWTSWGNEVLKFQGAERFVRRNPEPAPAPPHAP